jgi:hypothetical protein
VNLLGVKQYKRRKEKRDKKEAKKLGQAISSGGESIHYLERSMQRGGSGAAVPCSRKQVRELIATGEVEVTQNGKNKIMLHFGDGRRIIVSKNLKTVITYMD